MRGALFVHRWLRVCKVGTWAPKPSHHSMRLDGKVIFTV